MRIIKRIGVAFLVILVVLGLIAGGGFLYVTRKPFPQINGTVRLVGVQDPVTIVRDKWGVPHIYAANPHDLFFAQGYVTAQDRLWQMEFWRRVGAGRLAELFGNSMLKNDLFIRTLGWRRAAQADYELMEQQDRDVLQQYADGVNAFIAGHRDNLPLEFTILRLTGVKPSVEPWTPLDTLTWSKVLAWDQDPNWENELLRSRVLNKHGVERGQQIISVMWSPVPASAPIVIPSSLTREDWIENMLTASQDLRALLQTGREEIGSNGWVIAGNHTTTGKPLLANDMHMGMQMPSIWYEVGLHCQTSSADCPYNVVGYSFPGIPGVIVGHNDKVAWGITTLLADVQDLYVEQVNPQNANQYLFEGRWEDMQIIRETVRVSGKDLPKGFQPTPDMQASYDPATNMTSIGFDVRWTRHGPILSDAADSLRDSSGTISMKWTVRAGSVHESLDVVTLHWVAHQPSGSALTSLLALDRAQNWNDFRDALSHWNISAPNFIFADVEGNIGYQATGRVPIRAQGDGWLPVPGWTGEYEWTGFIPFDELPSRFNPPEGFIVTANNTAVGKGYPFFITYEWDRGFRAQRLTDLVRAKDKFSLDDMRAIQGDNYNLSAGRLMPYFSVIHAQTPLQQSALNALKEWDGMNLRNSVGATVFEALAFQLVLDVFGDELGREDVQAYWGDGSTQRASVIALMDRPDDPIWDDVGTVNGVETRDNIVQRAFESACADLQSRLGDDVSRWTWGRLHTVTFRNGSLGSSGIPPIEAIFNRGPVVLDGSTTVVNNTPYYAWPRSRYNVRQGPSQRLIADLADWTRSLSVHTTGQSGQPYHKHYDDFIDLWRNLQYHPMLWSRLDVEENAEGALVLMP